MPTDLKLLRRYHMHGDAFAFSDLVQAHTDMVFATAKRVTHDAALAEDVSQETFLELARQAHGITESVAAWLHRVAWRRACNAVRGQATRRRCEEAAAPMLHAEPEPTWEELEPLVDEALEGLSAPVRGLLIEHFLERHSQQEIAKREGISQSSVSRMLDKGISELRSRLRSKGVFCGAGLALVISTSTSQAAPASLNTALGKLALSGVGTSTSISAGTALTTAFLTMSTTKVILTGAAVAVLAGIPIIIQNQPPTLPSPKPLTVVPTSKAAGFTPAAKAQLQRKPVEASRDQSGSAPVSDSVRQQADAFIRQMQNLSVEEFQQSLEFQRFTLNLMNLLSQMTLEMESRLLRKLEAGQKDVKTLTGGSGLFRLDSLEEPGTRGFIEAVISEEPERLADWVTKLVDGAVFELALDPSLEKTSDGVTIPKQEEARKNSGDEIPD